MGEENGSTPRFLMFSCKYCSAQFVDCVSRQIHVMQEHSNLLPSCQICHKLFATKSERNKHMINTHGKYTEDISGKSMQSDCASSTVKGNDLNRKHCVLCNSSFSTEALLKLHLQLIHNGSLASISTEVTSDIEVFEKSLASEKSDLRGVTGMTLKHDQDLAKNSFSTSSEEQTNYSGKTMQDASVLRPSTIKEQTDYSANILDNESESCHPVTAQVLVKNSFITASKEQTNNSTNMMQHIPVSCPSVAGVVVKNSFNTTNQEQIEKDQTLVNTVSTPPLDMQCFCPETSKGLCDTSLIGTEKNSSLGVSSNTSDQKALSNNSLNISDKQPQVGHQKKQENQSGNTVRFIKKLADNPKSDCYKKLVSFFKENCSIPRYSMFPCSDCSAHFMDSISRQIHVMQEHPHLLFSCELCHKLFVTNGEKTRHIKSTHGKIALIHDVNGSLRYRCKVCNLVEFDSFDELVSHSPCPSDVCEKTVKYAYELDTLEQIISRHNSSDSVEEKSARNNNPSVQDVNEHFTFDFLDDRNARKSYSSQELQEKLLSDDQIVMSSGYNSNNTSTAGVSANMMPTVDSSESKLAMSACDAKLLVNAETKSSLHESELEMRLKNNSNHILMAGVSADVMPALDSESVVAMSVCASKHTELGVDAETKSSLSELELEMRIKNNSNHTLIADVSEDVMPTVDSESDMTMLVHNGKHAELSVDDETKSSISKSELEMRIKTENEESSSSSMLEDNENDITTFTVGDKMLKHSENQVSECEQFVNTDVCESEKSSSEVLKIPHCPASEKQISECDQLSNTETYESEKRSLVLLNTSHCPASENRMGENEISLKTEVCEPEESFHFTEGGESWTISMNIDHDDTELDSDPTVKDEYTKIPLNENYVNSPMLEPMDTTEVTHVDRLVRIEKTVHPETSVDVESCSLCHQVFESCLELKKHISLQHKENVNEATDLNFDTSLKTCDVYNAALNQATDLNLVSSLKTCDIYNATSNRATDLNVDTSLKTCDIYNENVNEAKSVNLDNNSLKTCDLFNINLNETVVSNLDSSLEICGLCKETFHSLSQMKNHIKSVHWETSEFSSSAQTSASGQVADDDNAVPLVMQVIPTCKHVDEGTDSSDVGFVENRITLIKTETFCEDSTEQNVQMETGQLNVTNLQGSNDKTDILQIKSNTAVKESCSDECPLDEDASVRKKRKYVRMKTRSSSRLKKMLQNSADEDKVPKERRVKRKYVRKKPLSDIDMESKQQVSTDEGNAPKQKYRIKRKYVKKKESVNAEAPHVLGDKTKGNNSSNSAEDLDSSLDNVESISGNAKHPLSQNTCRHCRETFAKKSVLVKHLVSEHPENLRRCDLCNKVFPYAFLKRKHMEKYHNEEPVVPVSIVKSSNHDLHFQCPQCPERLADKKALSMHALVRHSRNYMYYPCELCDKVFAYPGLKRKHLAMVHFVMECNITNATNSATQAMILSFNSQQKDIENDLQTASEGQQNLDDTTTSIPIGFVTASNSEDTSSTIAPVIASPGGISSTITSSSAFGLTTNSSLSGLLTNSTSRLSPSDISSSVGAPTNLSTTTISENTLPGDQLFDTTNNAVTNMKSSLNVGATNSYKDLSSEASSHKSNGCSKDVINVTMFPCKFCHEEFDSLPKLADHAISMHSGRKPRAVPQAGSFPCKFCDREFSSLTWLGNHAISFHRRDMPFAQYPCECGRLFTTTSGLAQHLRLTCKLNSQQKSVVSKSVYVFPDSKSLISESQSVVPESKSIIPDSISVISGSHSAVPESESALSESVFPGSDSVVTEASCVIPGSQSIVPESKYVVAESKSPFQESGSVASKSNSKVTESNSVVTASQSVVPQSGSVVSKPNSIVPESSSVLSGPQCVVTESSSISEYVKSIKPVHIQTGVCVNGRLKPFSCKFCDHWFLSQAHLRNHALRSHPSVLSVPKHPCHCGKVFRSVKDLQEHQLMHKQTLVSARNKPVEITPEQKQKHEQELFRSVLNSVFKSKQ